MIGDVVTNPYKGLWDTVGLNLFARQVGYESL